MKINQRGLTGLEFLVPAVIIGLSAFLYAWFCVDYETEILVKEAEEYPGGYVYGPFEKGEGKLNKDYWLRINVQIWAFYLFCTEFNNPETRPNSRLNKYGIFEIFIDGEWKSIACGQKGDYLLIGCEMGDDLRLIPGELKLRMLVEMQKCLEGRFDPSVLRAANMGEMWRNVRG